MSGRYLNPPFDPRILRIGPPSLGSHKLKRGKLVRSDNVNGKKGPMEGKAVAFLYNPVAVTASHYSDPAGVMQQGGGQVSTQMGQIANLGGVSVSLLYDRTFEVWDSSKQHTLAGRYGVYSDILAFYELTGITVSTTTKKVQAGVSNTVVTETITNFNQYPVNFMDPSARYYLYMGDKLRWYGVITDLEIEYSHFTQNMVPSRAAVSISMQFQKDSGGKQPRRGVSTSKDTKTHKPKPKPSAKNPPVQAGPIG